MNEFVEKMKKIGWNVRVAEVFRFASQHACLKMVEELTGLKEGVVVYNTKTHMRVKIKSPTYLAAHRLRGNGLTLNSVCELVAMNEYDEYLAVFPEDESKFDEAISMYEWIKAALILNYDQSKGIESQKDFALAVKDLPQSGVMFKARKNCTDIIHEFNQFPVSKRADWLKEVIIKSGSQNAELISQGKLGAQCYETFNK